MAAASTEKPIDYFGKKGTLAAGQFGGQLHQTGPIWIWSTRVKKRIYFCHMNHLYVMKYKAKQFTTWYLKP